MLLLIAIISFAVLMLAIILFRKFAFGDGLTRQQRKTIEQYKYLPLASYKNAKQYAIVIIIALYCMLSKNATAQMFCEIGPGVTNGYFSGELQAGYRYGNTIATVGYIAIPNNTQPVLFNVRGGMILKERLLMYAGYVRVMQSSDMKQLNYNTWQVGAQYHMLHFDRGTFYIGSTYSGDKRISAHIGMTYNLSRGLE